MRTEWRKRVRRGSDAFGMELRAQNAAMRFRHALDRETRRSNAALLKRGAPDGYPLPSDLSYAVVGHFDLASR